MIDPKELATLAKTLNLDISISNKDLEVYQDCGDWWLMYKGKIVGEENLIKNTVVRNNCVLPLSKVPSYIATDLLRHLSIYVINAAIQELLDK